MKPEKDDVAPDALLLNAKTRAIYTELALYGPRVQQHFLNAVHDTGHRGSAESIAAEITYEYLTNVFGDNPQLKLFARELIASRKGQELQLLVDVTNDRSQPRSADEIISEVKQRALKESSSRERPGSNEPDDIKKAEGSSLRGPPHSMMVGLASVLVIGIAVLWYLTSTNEKEFIPSRVPINSESGSSSRVQAPVVATSTQPGPQQVDTINSESAASNSPPAIALAPSASLNGMNLQTLCQKALNSSRDGWDSTDGEGAVPEAKKRGLSIDNCVRLTLPVHAAVASPSPSTPTTGLEGAAAAIVCKGAINGLGTGWDAGPSYQKHVAEALRRGLSLTDCIRIANLTPPVSPSSTGLEGSSVADVCRAALNSSGNAWDTNPNYSRHVQEASRRGMSVSDCAKIVASPSNAPSNSRTRYESKAGWNAQFNLQDFYVDPEANDSFNPRSQAYVTVLKSRRTTLGEPAIIFIQVSINTKCVKPSTYANAFSNRIRRLTVSDQSDTNWFNFYVESSGFKIGDQIKDFLVLDRISTRRADESTLVHVGARGPSEMASLIRSEFNAILSNFAYPVGPFAGRCQ